jgi:hypothetical protein
MGRTAIIYEPVCRGLCWNIQFCSPPPSWGGGKEELVVPEGVAFLKAQEALMRSLDSFQC